MEYKIYKVYNAKEYTDTLKEIASENRNGVIECHQNDYCHTVLVNTNGVTKTITSISTLLLNKPIDQITDQGEYFLDINVNAFYINGELYVKNELIAKQRLSPMYTIKDLFVDINQKTKELTRKCKDEAIRLIREKYPTLDSIPEQYKTETDNRDAKKLILQNETPNVSVLKMDIDNQLKQIVEFRRSQLDGTEKEFIHNLVTRTLPKQKNAYATYEEDYIRAIAKIYKLNEKINKLKTNMSKNEKIYCIIQNNTAEYKKRHEQVETLKVYLKGNNERLDSYAKTAGLSIDDKEIELSVNIETLTNPDYYHYMDEDTEAGYFTTGNNIKIISPFLPMKNNERKCHPYLNKILPEDIVKITYKKGTIYRSDYHA